MTSSLEKSVDEVENLEHADTHGTYLGDEQKATLSEGHRKYLLARHGTLDLEPLPAWGDADPYNWPHWKVGLA